MEEENWANTVQTPEQFNEFFDDGKRIKALIYKEYKL